MMSGTAMLVNAENLNIWHLWGYGHVHQPIHCKDFAAGTIGTIRKHTFFLF
jgi:hypothetical protein